jgi:dipeptidyl aminopeptidase/acylaminoacyl peptidase
MRPALRLVPAVLLLASAAGLAQTPAPRPAAPPAAGYSGHGAESVSPEAIAKFAPPALPAPLAAKIQMLADVRAPMGGILSPDGSRLYFVWTVTGTPQVWRLDGPNTFPIQMTGGEDRTSIAGITPDGRTLVLSRDRKGEENPGLYTMPAAGGPLTVLQHLPGVQTGFALISEDGKWVTFRSNDVKRDSYRILRVELATGKKETVFDEPGLWGVADHRDDGRLLLHKATGSQTGEYWEWDPVKKTKTALLGIGETDEFRASYGKKDGELLVVTAKFGDFRRAYRWEAGKFEPITPELKWNVERAHVDRSKTKLFYSVNEGGYHKPHLLDPVTFKELPLPSLPAADSIGVGGGTRDGRYTTFTVSTAKAPAESWVYDWTAARLTKWVVPSTPEVDTSAWAVATLEFYPARDGTKIPAFVRRPARCEPDPCPVVVQFHGGPEAQAMPGFNPTAQLWVEAGFVLVEPNVRGSDGYGKKWLDADNGPRRLEVITDIEDAAKWARSAFVVNGKRPKVGVMGGSYGGYATLMAMTMFAGAYDAGVSNVGISSLVTFLQNTAPYRRILRASEYGDLEKDHDALVKLSATTYIDKLKDPLLIIAGANDPRVPVGEGIQMYEAAKKKGIPTGLVIFADEGHGAQSRNNRVLQTGNTILWMERFLKGTAAN